jgi:hypothetical protein
MEKDAPLASVIPLTMLSAEPPLQHSHIAAQKMKSQMKTATLVDNRHFAQMNFHLKI